ncbi:acyltransferase family protein [Aliirhizobium smilacinae]|uniref:acyltransferase family protein n=1 Tax=Aliirhizobium smilacinae TaxID=1395944 RepID=UPI0015D61E9A|nr:acyltransferase [Rhizobium smilacinae]
MKYIDAITGLRTVAVFVVFLCHSYVDFAPGGFIGVDVFFVISGYLITSILLNEVARTGTISIAGFTSAVPCGFCRLRFSAP